MTELELAEMYVSSTNVSVFLTGKAGTGKTTFLRRIVETTRKRCVVLAPTGVAAVNAKGVTIHSFLQLPLCPYLPDVKELVTEYQMPDRYKSLSKEKIRIVRSLDLLIIDEISMVRADLLDAVDMTLRRYRRSSKPFGGIQLLMIGDVQQLPPVVTDSEKPYIEQVYPSPFFFHSKALQRTPYVTIELKTVFRQQDSRFIDLLNKVREGSLDEATLALLNSRYVRNFNPLDQEAYIRLTTHNYQADDVNRLKLEQLTTQPIVLEASVDGNFPESSFPTSRHLVLKKGAQVMFLKNDSSGGAYYNGKIATVEDYDPEEGVAVVDREGNHIVVDRERWENVKYEVDASDNQIKQSVEGTFVQYPLRLAWAVTIHKSQGLTFDHVIVDAASAFASGQVYVALSRCRTLEGLVLATPISPSCVIDDADVVQFSRSFPSKNKVEEELGGMQVEYYYDLLAELFDFSLVYHSGDRLNSVYQRSLRRTFPDKALMLNTVVNDRLVTLGEVSERFRRQLADIRLQTGGDTSAPLLKERVDKAAAYFGSKVDEIMVDVPSILNVTVDKKTVAADFKQLSADFQESLSLKQHLLASVRENGFSTEVFNNAKAECLLKDSGKRRSGERKTENGKRKAESGKRKTESRERKTESRELKTESKPSSKPKEAKTPVWVEAAQQFSEGMTIDEIAAQRGIAQSTAASYLIKALEAGVITVDLLLGAQEFDEIVGYLIEENPKSLKEMYEHFGGRYQYYQLRAALIESKDLRGI